MLAMSLDVDIGVLGSAELGAGLWDMTAGQGAPRGRIRGLIQHSMARVSEANHLWLST
jgi:cytochrome d ubiquinol oxidase subunit II